MQAQGLTDLVARNRVMKEYVALRCCTPCHREKLTQYAPDTWEELVERYSRQILPPLFPVQQQQHLPVQQQPFLPVHQQLLPMQWQPNPMQRQLLPPTMTPPATELLGGQKNTRYVVNYEPKSIFDVFVPYKSAPNESVASEIFHRIPHDDKPSGEVYFFTRPHSSGYVKIGYSAATTGAEGRLLAQLDCYPGIVMGKIVRLQYPKRMEKLIHLQMAEHRVKIGRCGWCNSTHEEWFRMESGDAEKVMDEWVEVVEREALYDNRGWLTDRWWKRVNWIKEVYGEHQVTAKTLLWLLNLENEECLQLERKERLKREEEQRLWLVEKERLRLKEEERLRLVENQRLKQAEEKRLRLSLEERLGLAERERLRLEKERLRLAEKQRLRLEEYSRLWLEEEERLRLEEKDRLRLIEEERLKQAEEKRLKLKEEEQLKLEEDERLKLAEEARSKLQEKTEPEEDLDLVYFRDFTALLTLMQVSDAKAKSELTTDISESKNFVVISVTTVTVEAEGVEESKTGIKPEVCVVEVKAEVKEDATKRGSCKV